MTKNSITITVAVIAAVATVVAALVGAYKTNKAGESMTIYNIIGNVFGNGNTVSTTIGEPPKRPVVRGVPSEEFKAKIMQAIVLPGGVIVAIRPCFKTD